MMKRIGPGSRKKRISEQMEQWRHWEEVLRRGQDLEHKTLQAVAKAYQESHDQAQVPAKGDGDKWGGQRVLQRQQNQMMREKPETLPGVTRPALPDVTPAVGATGYPHKGMCD